MVFPSTKTIEFSVGILKFIEYFIHRHVLESCIRICSAKSELFLGQMEKFCIEIACIYCRLIVADKDYCF